MKQDAVASAAGGCQGLSGLFPPDQLMIHVAERGDLFAIDKAQHQIHQSAQL